MDRQIVRRSGDLVSHPLGAGAVAAAGTIAVLDADGYCVPQADAPSRAAIGLFAGSVSNPGAAAAVNAEVLVGTFRLDNDPSDPVARSHVGGTCYHSGPSAVSSSSASGARGVAGLVAGLEAAGVWVRMGVGGAMAAQALRVIIDSSGLATASFG